MIRCLLLLLYTIIINALHFNGGTIQWVPVNLDYNSSSITITIIQSYSWTYPTILCTNDVPVSTPGRLNANLTCIADCSTDGGYSNTPVNILTDCTSASAPLGMLTSQRSVNISLSLGAHFYLAYTGSAWRTLNNPALVSLSWSIVSFVDLRLRPDGIINTPPTARVVSPQYVIVNERTQIQIIVSDANTGDDIRCRWSSNSTNSLVNECSGVCYPNGMPTGTTLSNCTLYFQGPTASIWYAGAIQVEDFINTTSVTPMSSVPVQLLIYVTPVPTCSNSPIIMPLTGCLEVTAGVLTSFDISVLNLCNSNVTSIDIVVTPIIDGMQISNLSYSLTNTSLAYKIITWTPQTNQIGPNQLCMIAYTKEFVQSTQYCVTFIVITSPDICPTTTTTTTTTTSTDTVTTSTTITVITEVQTTKSAPKKGTSWGLIAGISSLVLPLAFCSYWCLYRLLWSPAAKQQRQEQADNEDQWRYRYLNSPGENILRTTTPHANEGSGIEVPRKSYQVYNILPKENSANRISSTTDSRESILISIYNNTNGRRSNSAGTNSTEELLEMGNAWMQPRTSEAINRNIPISRRITMAGSSASEVKNLKATNEYFNMNSQSNDQINVRAFSTPPFNIDRCSISQSQLERTSSSGQSGRLNGSVYNSNDWTRTYLFGTEYITGVPPIAE